MWQWWNYLCGRIPADKVALRINMDETSVCLFQGAGKGVVFVDKKRRRDNEPVQAVPSAKRRCCVTHVAFICDRSDLQPLLPQVVIANEHTFTAAGLAALQASCPANVKLVRQKSAWNNSALCATIIGWLGEALAPHLEGLQPLLLLDAVGLHTTPVVMRAFLASGIWPILVPARTTWLLQPLDADAFMRYKAHLREGCQKARAAHGSADLLIEQFIPCLCDTIRSILQGKRWAAAFDRDGFGKAQCEISSFVKKQLAIEGEGPLRLPATQPTMGQLAWCFPRNRKVPEAALWRPLQPPVPKALPNAPASSSAGPPALPGLPVGLARARLQQCLADSAKAESQAGSSAGAAQNGSADVGLPAAARGSRLPGGGSLRRVLPASFQRKD